MPLLVAQVVPKHIGWIELSPVSLRLWETGVSFLAGETGHVIAEPPREGYALVPAIAVVLAPALLAALAGKDYVIERNLLPALLPLAAVVALGFAAAPPRLSLLLAGGLCVYWLGFAIYVTQTPKLQRPGFRLAAQGLGAPRDRRAIVGWRLAADPIRWYLPGKAVQVYGGLRRVKEVDVLSKPRAAAAAANLLGSFRLVERVAVDRLTLTRYLAPQPVKISVKELKSLPTGFGANGVVLDHAPSVGAMR